MNTGYFRILAHKFDTWDEVQSYIDNLVSRGECKVLPEVVRCTKSCNGKIISGWRWQPYINEYNQLRFR